MEPIRSVARAASVLSAVAKQGASGARLVDIVGAVDLQKTTVHRLLATLVEIRWLEHDDSTGAFHLGLPMVGYGTVALNRHGLLDIANPRLMNLADLTEDTVFLSVRAGLEAICVDRVTGSFPIRTLTLGVGDRRPLGVGAGSLALLAWLDDETVERVFGTPSVTPGFTQPSPPTGRKAVASAREQGYAVNRGGVVPGAIGVGVPVLGADGRPVAALSVAAVESRLDGARIAEVAGLLHQEASILSDDLATVAPRATEATVRRLLPE